MFCPRLTLIYFAAAKGFLLNTKAGLSILSVNIQIMNAKFNKFESFIDKVNQTHHISTTCLQECWLNNTTAAEMRMFNLKDYKLFYQTKRCCGHGGLMIYAHNQFNCNIIDTIKQQYTGWEYLCVEISHKMPNSTRNTICNICRVPGDLLETFNIFIEEFSSFMNCVRNLKHVAYLCGDFNIDLLKIL